MGTEEQWAQRNSGHRGTVGTVRKIQTHPRCVTFNTFRKERAHTKKNRTYIYIQNTCQELANEKRSLYSINYHNSNRHQGTVGSEEQQAQEQWAQRNSRHRGTVGTGEQ